MAIKKVIRVISFGVFILTLLFLNYLRDLSLSAIHSIENNFNIAVATSGKIPTEVISDRIEALLPEDSGAYVKIKRSQEIFEEYKKNQKFSSRVPLSENVFNDYILVYPLKLTSQNSVDEMAIQIKNTDGVEEISYDKDALDICVFLKNNVVRYINFVLILSLSTSVILSLAYLYIQKRKPPLLIFSLSSYLAYLYYLMIAGALLLIGASSIYHRSGISFNWPVMIVGLALASALSALVFEEKKQ